MKVLAIISCKAKKKDYKCSAEEMYSDSPQYKHQMGFIKEYYDECQILSLKYGIVDMNEVIEPYNLTLTPKTNMQSSNPTITEESKNRWATKVKKQIADLSFQYDRIDLHLSVAYMDEIQEVLGIPNVIHVKLPNILQLKANYTKATELYNEQGDVQLEVVGSYVRWKNTFRNELLNKKMVLPWRL